MVYNRIMGKAKTKILLAEYDTFLASLLENELERAGFAVQVVHDGAQVLGQLRTERPDLLITNLILPGMLGFDILTEIKRDDLLRGLPVVVLSNLSQPSDVQKAKDVGAVAYCSKQDTTVESLVETIKEQIAN